MTATVHTTTRHATAGHRTTGEPPNYAARRLGAIAVLASLVVILASVVGAGLDAATDLGGRPAAASEIVPGSVGPTAHVAAPGDTLWAIAERYRGDVGRDRYVDALIALNGGTEIQVGQVVELP
jgi:nucleoid-associated protein YgaU